MGTQGQNRPNFSTDFFTFGPEFFHIEGSKNTFNTHSFANLEHFKFLQNIFTLTSIIKGSVVGLSLRA